jgi:pSer/pThr/pTyr-binding forkhead associated (FHA) protein/tetratricopeptide (TPR) repeat protein
VPKLVIFRGDAVEHEIRLAGTTVRIGRDNRNDIVLDDSLKGVSRFHAEIRAEAGKFFIVDLKSRNGVWMNGQRIKEKAALALGVPVTLGDYELALEDDVSTGNFGEEAPLLNQHTVVTAKSVDRKDGPSRSATRASMKAPVAATKRQVLLWSGVAAAILLIGTVTFAVVRYSHRPTPTVARIDVPLPPLTPPAPLPPEDSNKAQIDDQLTEARAQMAAGDYAGAVRDHLQPVLDLDSGNIDALDLKRQAEEAIAAAAQAQKTVRVVVPKQEPPPAAEVETPGIPRRDNEAWAEYTARVRRVQVAFSEGKSSLDKQEFAAALTHFRAVEHDQARYQGVDQLITEALGKQREAFDEAMTGGQQNEQAGKLHDARVWYQRALTIDPGSTRARDINASLLGRMNPEANKLFDQASLAAKLQEGDRAIRLYQQILELMLPGDEIREKAAKQLEVLKR